MRQWGEVTLTVSLDEMMPPLERNHLTNAVQSSCSHALRQDHVPLARSQKPRAIATRLLAIIHCCSRCTAQRSRTRARANPNQRDTIATQRSLGCERNLQRRRLIRPRSDLATGRDLPTRATGLDVDVRASALLVVEVDEELGVRACDAQRER